MFDKYIIVKDSLRNVVGDGGEVTGFAFDVRIAYYRGLAVSMVEAFDVTIDGEAVPHEDLLFTVKSETLDFEQAASRADLVWEMADAATVTVQKPGGLAEGQHDLAVTEYLRVSYSPTLSTTRDRKRLVVTR